MATDLKPIATSATPNIESSNAAASGALPPTPLKPCPWLAAGTLCQREWVRFIRQRNRVFGAIGQPVIFWLLFGLGLGPSFKAPGAAAAGMSYREYFFPGSLMLILLFTAIFATISIIEDRREGFLQSVLVSPAPRWSMVLGKLLGGTLVAVAQGLVFLALAPTQGISLSLVSFVAITLFIFLASLALTGLGFVIAWRLDSTQGFHAIMSVFLMPMWLLSGAFFPAPPWRADMGLGEAGLALVMQLNPLTYGVAGLRRLLYLSVESPPLSPDTPSLLVCWSVTLLFAVATFAAAWKISAQRTTADLL
jgi:ABC-2 type transport system permease protein